MNSRHLTANARISLPSAAVLSRRLLVERIGAEGIIRHLCPSGKSAKSCQARRFAPSAQSAYALRAVTNHSKVDPADQIRTEHLGGAHGGHRLSQRTDVRSERHDTAQHHGNRSDGGDLTGSEQAEHR